MSKLVSLVTPEAKNVKAALFRHRTEFIFFFKRKGKRKILAFFIW